MDKKQSGEYFADELKWQKWTTFDGGSIDHKNSLIYF